MLIGQLRVILGNTTINCECMHTSFYLTSVTYVTYIVNIGTIIPRMGNFSYFVLHLHIRIGLDFSCENKLYYIVIYEATHPLTHQISYEYYKQSYYLYLISIIQTPIK